MDEVEVSDYDSSGFKDFIAGLRDGGSASFTIWYQPKQAVHAQVLSDINAGNERVFRFWFPDSVAGTAIPDLSNSRSIFVGIFTGFSIEAQTNNAVTANVTVKIRRKPQLVVGTDS